MATIVRPTAMTPTRKLAALRLAAEGHSRQRIAALLGLSERTLRRSAQSDTDFAWKLDDAIDDARRHRRRPTVASLLRQLAMMVEERDAAMRRP